MTGRPLKSIKLTHEDMLSTAAEDQSISMNGRPHKLVGRPLICISAQFWTNCRPQLEIRRDKFEAAATADRITESVDRTWKNFQHLAKFQEEAKIQLSDFCSGSGVRATARSERSTAQSGAQRAVDRRPESVDRSSPYSANLWHAQDHQLSVWEGLSVRTTAYGVRSTARQAHYFAPQQLKPQLPKPNCRPHERSTAHVLRSTARAEDWTSKARAEE